MSSSLPQTTDTALEHMTHPAANTPAANAFNKADRPIYTLDMSSTETSDHNADLRALNKDVKTYNTTIQNLQAPNKDSKNTMFDKISAINTKTDKDWYSDFEDTTAKDIDTKIQANLGTQLTNVKAEYKDIAKINNTLRDANYTRDVHNTILNSDFQNQLKILRKTQNEIVTKTRVTEINQEYAEEKNKRIAALKIGLILSFIAVFPLVAAMSGYISWLIFFSLLVFIIVIYGIYLIYVFTQSQTDPYTSPYKSDAQAFSNWLNAAIGSAGDTLVKCKPCPKPDPNPDPTPDPDHPNFYKPDAYVGDNKGVVYYDGSAPPQLITAPTASPPLTTLSTPSSSSS